MGIVCVSIFAAMAPPASAQSSAVGLQSLVRIDWDKITPIVPRSGQQEYDITVTYEITKGWFLANLLFPFHIGRQVDIKLDVVDTPNWCTAKMLQATLNTAVKADNSTELKAKISISLDSNAPAYGGGYVTIKATVPKIGLIGGFEKEITLTFEPQYLPLIKPEPEGGNFKKIGPMDTASFPIKIENLGNDQTIVQLRVVNPPDGWVVAVDDEITLDEGEGSTGTAYVTVRPPKGFGYHDEDASIYIEMTPVRALNENEKGTPKTVTLLVESRGFSIIGLEVYLPIIIIIIVLLYVAYWFFKRTRK
jgi:hypothetical protein